MTLQGNDDLTKGGAIVAGVLIILTALAAFLVKVIPLLRNGKGAKDDKDAAGEKDTAFWQMEFRGMESRIKEATKYELRESESRIMTRLNDMYVALQTLIRWKGGD